MRKCANVWFQQELCLLRIREQDPPLELVNQRNNKLLRQHGRNNNGLYNGHGDRYE